MGRRRFRRGFYTDETVRGEPYSRRYSEAYFQNTADQTRDVRALRIRSDAFSLSLVAGAEVGLNRLCEATADKASSAHVESAVHVQDLARDV